MGYPDKSMHEFLRNNFMIHQNTNDIQSTTVFYHRIQVLSVESEAFSFTVGKLNTIGGLEDALNHKTKMFKET